MDYAEKAGAAAALLVRYHARTGLGATEKVRPGRFNVLFMLVCIEQIEEHNFPLATVRTSREKLIDFER